MVRERETFAVDELAICLSHFDLGLISKVEDFPRGSRRSPKIVIEAQKGKFLFKRRARGKDDLAKVAFTHQIQLWLAAQSFPLPHLIGTRGDNNSMFVRNGTIYEMFEYIEGVPYDGSLDATFHAGRVLALYHKLLADFQSDYTPPQGSYHNAPAIRQAIRNTVRALPIDKRPSVEVLTATVDTLENVYNTSAEKVNELGLNDWGKQIVHGDWHRGNMLFRDHNVVAVIDYDSARLQQRVIDFANGALQFSIIRKGDNLDEWPDHLDENRFKRFMRGYDSVNVISVAELKAVPHLMCESIIAEAALPIGTTGLIGHLEGFPFLQMVERKVRWMLAHADHLYQVAAQ
ncbi:MAG: phosphotransferase [Planctomycetaceae bacterium]|nr:phosphotransferase [Planctomycetaceae bacterium]